MAKRFDAGQLRHKLVLQQADYPLDADGGYKPQWVDVAGMWGAVEPLSAQVFQRAGSEEVDHTHRIIVRHMEAIKPDMRLLLGTRIFTVRTVHDLDETRRYTTILTREEAS